MEVTRDSRALAKRYLSSTNLSEWPASKSWFRDYLSSWGYALFHYCQRWYKFFSKIFIKHKDGTTTYRWRYPLQVLPFINTAYDLFFDDTTIKHESVRSLLDILGLINALLLGAALSMFMGVDYSELTQVDERYGYGPVPDLSDGYTLWWREQRSFSPDVNLRYARPSVFFFINVAKSISLYFVNVIVVVYVYVDMVGKMPDEDEKEDLGEVIKQSIQELASTLLNRDKTTEGLTAVQPVEVQGKGKGEGVDDILAGDDGDVEEEDGFERKTKENASTLMFEAWWKYSRYGVILCLFSTILGLYYAVWSCNAAVFIKYPDLWVFDHPAEPFQEPDNYELSPIYGWSVFFKGVGGLVVGTAVFCCGFGTTYRYSVEDDRKHGLLLRNILKTLKSEWDKVNNAVTAAAAISGNTAQRERDVDDKHRLHVGKAFAHALEQAFYFCIAIDDWASAHAVLISVRQSGLIDVEELDDVVSFILYISSNGDVVHGIKKHVKIEEKPVEVVRYLLQNQKSGEQVVDGMGSGSRVAPAEFVGSP